MDQKTIISPQQATWALYLVLLSGIISQGINPQAGPDSWISSLLALVMAIPLLLLFARLVILNPGKDLFQMLESALGKLIGKILTILFIIFGIVVSSMTLRGYVTYVTIESLPETPTYILYIAFLLIVAAYALYCGLEVQMRTLHLLAWVYTILAYGIITLSLNAVKVENLKPILYDGFTPVLNGAVDLLLFPYGTAILMLVPLASLKPGSKVYRIFLTAAFLAFIIMTLVFLRNLLVLGPDSLKLYLYPSHQSISLINIGGFIERMEIVPALINLILDMTKISVSALFVAKGLQRLFNIENFKTFIAPTIFLVFNYSLLARNFIPDAVEWGRYYKYFALPFEILLPLILYIVCEIRSRVSKMLKDMAQPADQNAA